MYARILLAFDGTTYAAPALRQGAEMARLCSSELHLLAIVPTTGGFAIAQAAGSLDVWGLKREQLSAQLEEAAKAIAGQCVKLVSVIREGDPASEILAYAREIKAELVVVGHRDRSVMARWFGGSTSSRLIEELRCSLLIAEPER